MTSLEHWWQEQWDFYRAMEECSVKPQDDLKKAADGLDKLGKEHESGLGCTENRQRVKDYADGLREIAEDIDRAEKSMGHP